MQQLLPSVAILNQKYAPPLFNPNQSTDSTTGNQPEQLSACTTSSHYAVVESEHPYKAASVMQYKVTVCLLHIISLRGFLPILGHSLPSTYPDHTLQDAA